MDESGKVCPFCEVIFVVDKIKDHIGKEHLGIMPDNSEQENHQYHRDSKKELYCETCAKSFLCSTSLEKHGQFVHPESIKFSHDKNQRKTWKCDRCGKTYFQRCKLKDHVQTIHKRLTHVRSARNHSGPKRDSDSMLKQFILE